MLQIATILASIVTTMIPAAGVARAELFSGTITGVGRGVTIYVDRGGSLIPGSPIGDYRQGSAQLTFSADTVSRDVSASIFLADYGETVSFSGIPGVVDVIDLSPDLKHGSDELQFVYGDTLPDIERSVLVVHIFDNLRTYFETGSLGFDFSAEAEIVLTQKIAADVYRTSQFFFSVSAVPEPGTLLMVGLAGVMVVAGKRMA